MCSTFPTKPVADSPSAPAIALRTAIIIAIHFLIPLGSNFCVLITLCVDDANIRKFCNMQNFASNFRTTRAGGGVACAPPTDRNQEGSGGTTPRDGNRPQTAAGKANRRPPTEPRPHRSPSQQAGAHKDHDRPRRGRPAERHRPTSEQRGVRTAAAARGGQHGRDSGHTTCAAPRPQRPRGGQRGRGTESQGGEGEGMTTLARDRDSQRPRDKPLARGSHPPRPRQRPLVAQPSCT